MTQDIAPITAATGALTDALARMDGFMDEIDGNLATRQTELDTQAAKIAGLTGDLKSVVTAQMAFTGIVDPDEAAPTNIDGGTFTSLRALIDAAPYGSYVRAMLADDKTHEIDDNISLVAKVVEVTRTNGGAARPVLSPRSFVSGAHNRTTYFTHPLGGALLFNNIDIVMPSKADAALPWIDYYHVLVQNALAPAIDLRLYLATFTGDDGAALVTANRGTIVNAAFFSSTLSGNVVGVRHVGGHGIAHIAKQGLTLTGGAVTQSGGLLGTSLLEN